MDNTDAEVCLFCLHEQVEVGEESKRWAAYLQTCPRLPSKALRIKESMAGNSNVTVRKKCLKCKTSHISAEVCRLTLGHTAPDWQVARAAQVTEAHAKRAGGEKVLEKTLKSLDRYRTSCHVCHQGGNLLCCDHCTRVWHMECVQPVMSRVPKGQWFCPQCFEIKPQVNCTPATQPVRQAAKRKSSKQANSSGLMDMVPSDLSFAQQIAQALRQSKREEEKRMRLSQGQRTLHVTATVVTMEATKESPSQLEAPLPKRRRHVRRHQRTQCLASDSEVTSDTSRSEVFSSDTVLDEELQSQDFDIKERTEKVELEGFSICASGVAL